ncbi:MAG: protein kinase [Candidatus Melainabacteria bacterium]|nr:protein kinase [Candidatus Melainabacteria bacterium]
MPERYDVLKELGSGAMGLVLLARDTRLAKQVAIKVLSDERNKEENIRRFQQEARLAGRLNHTNLVRVLDFGVSEKNHPYLVMDFVEGETLKDMISREHRLSPETTMEMLLQVATGMSYAHKQNLVHRDLKPSNIIATTDDAGKRTFKVLDFGIARTIDDDRSITRTHAILGSPLYMSPEQARSQTADTRSDIYSLGCIVYECLQGEPPFSGETVMDTLSMHISSEAPAPEAPPPLAELVGEMLSKRPDDRPASMDKIIETLHRIQERIHEQIHEQVKDRAPQDREEAPEDGANKAGGKSRAFAVILATVLLVAGLWAGSLFVRPDSVKKIPPAPRDLDPLKDMPPHLARKDVDLDELKEELRRHPDSDRMIFLQTAELNDEIFEILAASDRRQLDLRTAQYVNNKKLSQLKKLNSICVTHSDFNDQGAVYMAELENLAIIEAGGSEITDRGVALLAGLPKLETLELDNTVITDGALASLSRSKSLKRLHLDRTAISDRGLSDLSRIKSLEYLKVKGCPWVTPQGIAGLREALPGCTVVLR